MLLLLLSALAFGGGLVAQTPPASYPHYLPGTPLTGDFRITCESSAEPLMKLWVERFEKFHPGFEIIAKGTSPIASVPMVMSGAYELGFPARELWVSEEESFRKIRGYDATVIVVGLGAHKTAGLTPALGVYVNASNPIEKITLDQLDAIYSAERRRGSKQEIKTWGDLGLTGEWASRPIDAYIHRLPNGVDYFIKKIVNQGADFKKSVIQLPMRRGKLGPDEVIADVAVHDPAAIGFGCLGNVVPGMKTIALAENSHGPFYAGTLEEVKRMDYPFARPIYMVVDREPGQPLPPKIREFLTFVLSQEGQDAIVASDGWLPLPSTVAAAELAKLK
ncbi:MAG: Phosphate transport system substrate-binding protein [Verrucomicrobia bacterium]|nr:Phosphate transport system substrate-binding protein [Verrucomicrobiota bacterium]